MRRIRCQGDCGRWWYYQSAAKYKGGRPRQWCEDCRLTNKRAARNRPRHCDVCGDLLGKYRGSGPRDWCDRCFAQERRALSCVTGRSKNLDESGSWRNVASPSAADRVAKMNRPSSEKRTA